MNALIPMEDVSTFVLIQLEATIAHVMLIVLLMPMITVAHVCKIQSKPKHLRRIKGAAKYYRGLIEKDMKMKWTAKASCF